MSSPAIQPMETANANPSAQAPNPSAGPSASPSNPPNPSNPPTTYNSTYTALDNDFMTFLQQLSDHHRQEVLAIRSARRHKLFALICFLFFIVVRLWILAILEKDWFLMSFCLLCTVFTFHAWKKERTRGDAEVSKTKIEAYLEILTLTRFPRFIAVKRLRRHHEEFGGEQPRTRECRGRQRREGEVEGKRLRGVSSILAALL